MQARFYIGILALLRAVMSHSWFSLLSFAIQSPIGSPKDENMLHQNQLEKYGRDHCKFRRSAKFKFVLCVERNDSFRRV